MIYFLHEGFKMRVRNHEILGKVGAYEVLELIDRNVNINEALIVDKMGFLLSPLQTKKLIKELLSIAFIRQTPGYQSIELTDIGREAFLLVKVINGANLDSVVNQLSGLHGSNFSLVTQDICGCFLNLLKNRYDVEEVYICSPWVRLSDAYLADLEEIIQKTLARIKFRIITRPPSELVNSPPLWRKQSLRTLQWFKEHDAELVKLRKLHTKLYCAIGNCWQTAFFGSENLTEAGNIELGIRIDDERMTQKLLNYFNQIYSHSTEILEDELYVEI
jgi:hypothetical protein